MDPDTGRLDMDDLARVITPRCRLLAIGAASNALGTVSDVRAAADIAHAAGALVFVDAVHYASHVLVDVDALDCDFLGCSPYKFYGPHIGALRVRGSLVDNLDVPKLIPAPDTGGERLETGTQNHEGIVGAAAAVEFLASIGDGATRRERLASAYHELHIRAEKQVAMLWNGLRAHERVTLFGPEPGTPRTSTVSFTVEGVPSTAVAKHLASRGLFVSHGDFYATTVIERLGLDEEGLVRIGCACYNTDAEVERLLGAVAEVCSTH
jgi:selenocysteine lyase/cysteine desulfurase